MSMGRRGDAYDNAVAESFFATLETELLQLRHPEPGPLRRPTTEGFSPADRIPLTATKGAHNHPVDNKSRSVQKSGVKRLAPNPSRGWGWSAPI